ncbi:MAG TPA: hypothetical protein VKI44_21450 [Acetobacteraceae bacterium]|nr:hypothetical protein [Acetobacteraceae bacterium]
MNNTIIVAPGVDCSKPGIYRWDIEGAGVYIGKYRSISRPTKQYARNVRRLRAGLPYHIKGSDYRRVHKALAEADANGKRIVLTILANAKLADLNQVEQEYIRWERANLNGPAT